MLTFQYPFRPEEDYSSSWKLFYNSTRCSVPEITSLLQGAKDMFDLSTSKGLIPITTEIHLSPFEMQTMPSISKDTGHAKQVHVITEPREQGFSNEVVATSTYEDLKLVSSRVKICFRNLTLKKIVIPTWCVMGQIQVANEVPEIMYLLHQRALSYGSHHPK